MYDDHQPVDMALPLSKKHIISLDGDGVRLGQAVAIGVLQCTNDGRTQALGTSLMGR
jgi:hypothetical protein